MKIVFCKSGFAGPISGADEIAVTYAVELKAAGHTTEVLLVHHGGHPWASSAGLIGEDRSRKPTQTNQPQRHRDTEEEVLN